MEVFSERQGRYDPIVLRTTCTEVPMSRTFDTIRFALIRLMVFMAWSFVGVSGAAADNLIDSGYKALVELLNSNNPPQRKYSVVRLRNDGRPFILHGLPSERSTVSARLYPPTTYFATLRGCVGAWCHVRVGPAYGWLRKDRLELDTANEKPAEYPRDEQAAVSVIPDAVPVTETVHVTQDAAPVTDVAPAIQDTASITLVNIPLPVRKGVVPPLQEPARIPIQNGPVLPLEKPVQNTASPPLQNTLPLPLQHTVSPPLWRQVIENREVAEAREKAVAANLSISNITKKKYALTRVEGITFLPVREDPADDARIVGSIPFFAEDVEALGICVNEWCLVHRGDNLHGWIRRHHLSDTPPIAEPLLQLASSLEQSAIPVFKKPDEEAEIASYLNLPATDIEPIGACDQNWCYIRYYSTAGWVQSKYLSRQ